MRRSHARGLVGRAASQERKARRTASWRTSSASAAPRVNQRARLWAAGKWGRSALSKGEGDTRAGIVPGQTPSGYRLFPAEQHRSDEVCHPARRNRRARRMEMAQRTRREFLQLAGVGGVVFASGLLAACASAERPRMEVADDFYFVQLSDTHWGYKGPANPEAAVELPRAVELVNALPRPPDFVIFTGDLTHTTDDPAERRRRMAEFRAHAARLKVPGVRFMPGEHDASLDRGRVYEENFGPRSYTFDHKGVHFVALDNVSDPKGILGDEQIDWLARGLKQRPKETPIVVFTHPPPFHLKYDWDGTTGDGSRAIDVLHAHPHVTVFYGHIHQEHHQMTDHIAHHAARSLVFALPPPGSQPKRAPVPWDAAHPGRGLGFRDVDADPRGPDYRLREIAIASEA